MATKNFSGALLTSEATYFEEVFGYRRIFMRKQEVRRLTLNRETIRRLDPSALGGLFAGDPVSTQICCPTTSDNCLHANKLR